MERNIKIRINLISKELEVEGDRDFILDYLGDDLRDYFQIIKGSAPSTPNPDAGHPKQSNNNDQADSSFGEYFNKFSKKISNVDKLLIASYYIQLTSSSKTYTVGAASQILIDQNVKLSNPSAFNAANLQSKRAFKIAGNEFRVSDSGISHIKTLMAIEPS